MTWELPFITSLPPPPQQTKMAAVVERIDGCVGSLDTDSVSPRLSTPPPDQPHQNNPLLGLPIVAIETILNFLSYDEISLLRSVRRTKTNQLTWLMLARWTASVCGRLFPCKTSGKNDWNSWRNADSVFHVCVHCLCSHTGSDWLVVSTRAAWGH